MKEQSSQNTTSNFLSLTTAATWLGILLYVSVSYMNLPELIPTHFRAAGTPDSYGSKYMLLITCLVGLAVTTMLAIVPKYPHLYNIPFSIDSSKRESVLHLLAQMSRKMNLCVAALFLLLIGGTIQIAKGHWEALPPVALVSILSILFCIIMYDTYRLWQYRDEK